MRFLIDEGLPRSTAQLLMSDGHDCVHVGDVALTSRSDEIILAYAISQQRVILTLDADFHALMAEKGLSRPSVIRFRMNRLRALDLHRIVMKLIAEHGAALAAGVAMSVDAYGVRTRKLPL